ncbi:MAG: CapA family protein [Clostridiales Family XIII bacterium]|nr:CapA family protein [Clostridiales Family XIII bacterium]
MGLLAAILLFSSCAETGEARRADADGAAALPSAAAPAEPAEEPVSLRILCAGDVMVHAPQLAAQRDETGAYDFRDNFTYVKPYISEADLALCNLETTLGGEPYTGYPTFSSPDSLADAIADAGFDAVFTSNNHMLDRGAAGLHRTTTVARAAGLATVGSRLSEDEPASVVVRCADASVGLVAFTYESPRAGESRTLNGIRIGEALRPLINSFGYEDLDGDLARVDEEIRRVREAGAEIVVCYFHWGEEYKLTQNGYQEYIASRAAISGADIIFASHPHVPQGMEYLSPAPGRSVPVFYSLGNFISNQRTETTGSRHTEQGLMAAVDLRFMRGSGEIVRIEAKVLPTWVDRYRSGGREVYAIVPLADDFENNPALLASGHADRARRALAYCEELFGEAMLIRS